MFQKWTVEFLNHQQVAIVRQEKVVRVITMGSFSKRFKKVFSSSSRTDLRAQAQAQAQAQAEASRANERPDQQQQQQPEQSSLSQQSASETKGTKETKDEQKKEPVNRKDTFEIREDAPPRYEEAIGQPPPALSTSSNELPGFPNLPLPPP